MRYFCDPKETYVSVDVETNGPVPGLFSMLSIGCVALSRSHGVTKQLGEYYGTILPLEGAGEEPTTMQEFWAKHPAAYAWATEGARTADVVLPELLAWLRSLPGSLVFVADPAGFDFMFTAYYLHRFAGACPFGWSALDLHTLAWSKVRRGFKRSQKRELPATWTESKHEHDHHALHDARQQADVFCGILQGLEEALAAQERVQQLTRELSRLV